MIHRTKRNCVETKVKLESNMAGTMVVCTMDYALEKENTKRGGLTLEKKVM